MKTLITVLLAICATTTLLATVNEHSISASLETSVASSNTTENGVRIYNGGMLKSVLSVEHHDLGLFADIGASTGFDSEWPNNAGDELEYSLGWQSDVGVFNLGISGTYIDSGKHMLEHSDEDILVGRFGVGLANPIVIGHSTSLIPSIEFGTFQVHEDAEEEVFESGNIFGVSINLVHEATEKVNLLSSSFIGYDDGFMRTSPGVLCRQSLSLEVEILEHLKGSCGATIYAQDGINTVIFGGLTYEW